MNKKFYITSAIPYVNAKPHVGHALEFIQTNTIARFHRLLGYDVTTLSGGDENALKNVQAAEKSGQDIQDFIDEHNQEFEVITKALNATYDIWQRGSDQKTHFPSSQELWARCEANGDIYKKTYKGLYCVGCETFYEPSELSESGECYEHPGKTLDEIEEENYFFKLSKYQQRLEKLIAGGELKIVPEFRKNEVLSFIKAGLEDISISRSNERAKNWGVPIPGDSSQRMYVWFDALNIYQSGIGFGWDEKRYEDLWPADIQVIGKGIIRFHAVYWPAFLISAGLKLPKALFVHEYFTVDGQKMSKTIGNVYDPMPLLEAYGADPFRYYCLAKISPFSDGDFSEDKFFAAYNGDLANSLGNTVQRIATLAARSGASFAYDNPPGLRSQVREQLEDFRFDLALAEIWKSIAMIEKKIDEAKPWKLEGQPLQVVLMELIAHIRQVGYELGPFMPETSAKINQIFNGPKIEVPAPLFPRLQENN